MRKPTPGEQKLAGTGRVDQHDFSKKGAEFKDLSLNFIVMFHLAAELAGIPNQVQKIDCKNERGNPAELYVVEFEEMDPNLVTRYHGTHLGCLCGLLGSKMQLMEPGDDDWTGMPQKDVSWVANKRFEISKFKFKIPRARTCEHWQGSFSAVSKPHFASNY